MNNWPVYLLCCQWCWSCIGVSSDPATSSWCRCRASSQSKAGGSSSYTYAIQCVTYQCTVKSTVKYLMCKICLYRPLNLMIDLTYQWWGVSWVVWLLQTLSLHYPPSLHHWSPGSGQSPLHHCPHLFSSYSVTWVWSPHLTHCHSNLLKIIFCEQIFSHTFFNV